MVEKQSAEQLELDCGIDDTSCSSQSSLIAMAAMASTLRSEPTGISELDYLIPHEKSQDTINPAMTMCLSEKPPATASLVACGPTYRFRDVMS